MLGRTVYQKATHTDLYLNKESLHHPTQKCGVILTLLERAYSIAHTDYLDSELSHLHTVFCWNGYTVIEIKCAFACCKDKNRYQLNEDEDSIHGAAMFHYCSMATNHLTRLLWEPF